jgi:hypothetical protein
VSLQAARPDVPDLEPAAAESGRRSLPGGKLRWGRVPLPGDEAAVDREEWKGQLDELAEVGDGAGRHRRPVLSFGGVAGRVLGPAGTDGDSCREPDRRGCHREEAGLLGDRLDEHHPAGGQDGREGQPGIPAAAAEVDEGIDPALPKERDPAQAVDDVANGDPGRIADGREVDRLVPRQEQPDVTVELVAG